MKHVTADQCFIKQTKTINKGCIAKNQPSEYPIYYNYYISFKAPEDSFCY